MTFIEFFRKQFIEEAAITRKFLERVPDSSYDYKPHEKSMVMKYLITHLADLPGWVHLVLTTDELNFQSAYEQPDIKNNKDLLNYFDKRYNDGLSVLTSEYEKEMNKPWTLRNGGTVYSTNPKFDVIRMALSQQIHHRAQLGVYLRLLNVPIPGSYGPSADENHF
jgi:uncharacterized damage-inducible protein DinB